jgi:hypothetical protein
MKVCVSRKGIDSGARSGRMASPILPCGCLCSIPIPYAWGIPYSGIWFGDRSVQQIVRELNPNWSYKTAHLDPDLRFDSLVSRPTGWRPAFGQTGAAAGHLINQSVGIGDLFIFFGWFRRTVRIKDRLAFDPKDVHGRHIVYGWLQVGEVIEKLPLPHHLLFLKDHPHVHLFKNEVHPNKIYVSSQTGLKAGVFPTELESVVLTKEGGRRSRWLLPETFESLFLERDLTYHGKETRWDKEGTRIGLQAVSRGQEFVLDGKRHPAVCKYFVDLIKATSTKIHRCSHGS